VGAPDLIVHGDGDCDVDVDCVGDDEDCDDVAGAAAAGAFAGIADLLRRAKSTLALAGGGPNPTTAAKKSVAKDEPKSKTPRDPWLGRDVVVVANAKEEGADRGGLSPVEGKGDGVRRRGGGGRRHRRPQKGETSATTGTTARDSQPSEKTPSLLRFVGDRFLCDASLGDALRAGAAAGHHCDEDHVGLYVVDSDEDGGGSSSIATADLMGF
jgi:hypothetical protein